MSRRAPRAAPLILSLCDYSGAWVESYSAAGYEVLQIDLIRGEDVRLLEFLDRPVHGILAAPPCTAFAVSGSQYWKAKDGDGRTLEGLALVDACLRAVAIYRPAWWALENPVGRLRRWLGPPADSFDPCDFAGWGSEADRYTKRTLLWGSFAKPERRPASPIRAAGQGSWVQGLGGSGRRTKTIRSQTPAGFARAFFAANP